MPKMNQAWNKRTGSANVKTQNIFKIGELMLVLMEQT